jgi:CubicO group peptidase (beta-lactamase class C family)
MSAAIAPDGVVLWARGFGYADMAARKAATPETVYYLSSLTKPFAATVLLQLVQEERLDLDSPVSDYGLQLKSEGIIRVRHLLTHTSEGIPGETYRYSSNRFGQLDKVLAGVTGHSFASEVSQRILEPLALISTSPNPESPESCREARRDPEEVRRRLAQSYSSDGITPVEYEKHFGTAGGLVSTVGDMVRFSDALDADRLLRSDTRRLMFTPAVTASGKRLPCDLGWFVQDRGGMQLVWHYGRGVGDSSLIIKVPERKLTFVLLANSDSLSRKFDLGADLSVSWRNVFSFPFNDVQRSPLARAFLESVGL